MLVARELTSSPRSRRGQFTKLLDSSKTILRRRTLDVGVSSRSPSEGAPMPKPSPLPTRTRPRLLRVLVVVAAIAGATSLAACGGSKSPASAAAAERSSEQQDETKLAKFAKCMREHGVEASTSKGPDGHGFGLQIKGKAGAGRSTLESAQRACKQYQPEPKKLNLSPQEKVAQEEAVLKFAKCMREHGVHVHASTSNGRVQMQVGGPGGSGGPNPESPAFQAAQKACQSLLPFGKHGPGPGAPRTSKSPDAGGPGSGATLGIGG
jgi:hypothetical protein